MAYGKRCKLNESILPGNGFSFPVGIFAVLLYESLFLSDVVRCP
jgi:hypothetical protein